MKYIQILSLLFIIPIILSFSGCFDNGDNSHNNDVIESIYKYHVEITLDIIGEYTIYLPLIIYENATITAPAHDKSFDYTPGEVISDYLDFKIVEGVGEVIKIDTKYGYAYQIKSNETIILEFEKNYEFDSGTIYPYLILNLDNRSSNNERWISGDIGYNIFRESSNSNQTISLIISFEMTTNDDQFGNIDITCDLEDGWHSYNGTINRLTA